MKIVLRIAGSILGSPPDARLVSGYAHVISKLISEGNSLAVVVGGGPLARSYIEAAKALGLRLSEQDQIGLNAARLNAKLIAMKLGINKPVPVTVEEMIDRLKQSKVEVMGGLKPGITTDAVSVLVAERWKADLIVKGTNQKGIHTSDPAKDKKARKLDEITHIRMQQILSSRHKPGIHSIVDPVAVKRLAKSRIKLIVLDGSNPQNMLAAVHGKKVGTLVSSK
jgi:uridylate kinase